MTSRKDTNSVKNIRPHGGNAIVVPSERRMSGAYSAPNNLSKKRGNSNLQDRDRKRYAYDDSQGQSIFDSQGQSIFDAPSKPTKLSFQPMREIETMPPEDPIDSEESKLFKDSRTGTPFAKTGFSMFSDTAGDRRSGIASVPPLQKHFEWEKPKKKIDNMQRKDGAQIQKKDKGIAPPNTGGRFSKNAQSGLTSPTLGSTGAQSFFKQHRHVPSSVADSRIPSSVADSLSRIGNEKFPISTTKVGNWPSCLVNVAIGKQGEQFKLSITPDSYQFQQPNSEKVFKLYIKDCALLKSGKEADPNHEYFVLYPPTADNTFRSISKHFHPTEPGKITTEGQIIIKIPVRENDVLQKLDTLLAPGSYVPENQHANMVKIFEDANREAKRLQGDQVPTVATSKFYNQVDGPNTRQNNREPTPRQPTPREVTPPSQSKRQTRNSKAATLPPNHAIFTYNNVTIYQDEYDRLKPKQFLNDSMIEFYIQYLIDREFSSTIKQETHFFNSFFYNQLTGGRSTDPSDMHAQVAGWTRRRRQVDLFEKKYVIIPMNENLHWYLVVIVNPGALIKGLETGEVPVRSLPANQEIVDLSDDESVELETKEPEPDIVPGTPEADNPWTPEDKKPEDQETQENQPTEAQDDQIDSVVSDDPIAAMDIDSITLPDGVQKSIHSILEESDEDKPRTLRGPLTDEEKEKGYIVVMDSLANNSYTHVFQNLHHYLRQEAKAQKGIIVPSDRKLETRQAQVPEQSNFCDCGLYLLMFLQNFLIKDDVLLPMVIRNEKNDAKWFAKGEMLKRDKLLYLFETIRKEKEQEATQESLAMAPPIPGKKVDSSPRQDCIILDDD